MENRPSFQPLMEDTALGKKMENWPILEREIHLGAGSKPSKWNLHVKAFILKPELKVQSVVKATYPDYMMSPTCVACYATCSCTS